MEIRPLALSLALGLALSASATSAHRGVFERGYYETGDAMTEEWEHVVAIAQPHPSDIGRMGAVYVVVQTPSGFMFRNPNGVWEAHRGGRFPAAGYFNSLPQEAEFVIFNSQRPTHGRLGVGALPRGGFGSMSKTVCEEMQQNGVSRANFFVTYGAVHDEDQPLLDSAEATGSFTKEYVAEAVAQADAMKPERRQMIFEFDCDVSTYPKGWYSNDGRITN